MDGVNFEFNDVISLYWKNNSERRRFASQSIWQYYNNIFKLQQNNYEILRLNI